MGPPFRVPSGIFFRRSAMANSSGSSHHSGADAYGRQRRRRNSDAPWNSCPGRGQPDSRKHRACRRKRSVQRHPFIADSTNDRLAFRRTETAFGFAPRRARCWCGYHCALRQFCPCGFFGNGRSNEKYFGGRAGGTTSPVTPSSLLFSSSTMGLAYLLGKSEIEIRNRKSEVRSSEVRSQRSEVRGRWSVVSSPYVAAALCWLLFVEIGIAAWYRVHETNLVSGIRWSVQWPEQAPNFRKLNIDPEIRSVLRFDEGEAAAWTLASVVAAAPPASLSRNPAGTVSAAQPATAENARDPNTLATPATRSQPSSISCLLYVFRWNPGRNSALLANLHRPDVCLPASGWTQVADDGVRNYPVTGAFELPFRHFEFQRAIGNSVPQTAHAFYCLSEDRAAESSVPAHHESAGHDRKPFRMDAG